MLRLLTQCYVAQNLLTKRSARLPPPQENMLNEVLLLGVKADLLLEHFTSLKGRK
jgi:hypothetical protein